MNTREDRGIEAPLERIERGADEKALAVRDDRRVNVVGLDVVDRLEWKDHVACADARYEMRHVRRFGFAGGRGKAAKPQPFADAAEHGVEPFLREWLGEIIHRV